MLTLRVALPRAENVISNGRKGLGLGIGTEQAGVFYRSDGKVGGVGDRFARVPLMGASLHLSADKAGSLMLAHGEPAVIAEGVALELGAGNVTAYPGLAVVTVYALGVAVLVAGGKLLLADGSVSVGAGDDRGIFRGLAFRSVVQRDLFFSDTAVGGGGKLEVGRGHLRPRPHSENEGDARGVYAASSRETDVLLSGFRPIALDVIGYGASVQILVKGTVYRYHSGHFGVGGEDR